MECSCGFAVLVGAGWVGAGGSINWLTKAIGKSPLEGNMQLSCISTLKSPTLSRAHCRTPPRPPLTDAKPAVVPGGHVEGGLGGVAWRGIRRASVVRLSSGAWQGSRQASRTCCGPARWQVHEQRRLPQNQEPHGLPTCAGLTVQVFADQGGPVAGLLQVVGRSLVLQALQAYAQGEWGTCDHMAIPYRA